MIARLLALRGALDRATRWLALVAFASLVVICLITMYDGLARYLGMPRVPGFRDFGEVIFAVVIAACFPVGLLRDRNISITFLGAALGPRTDRVLNAMASVLVLVGFAIIAWALILRSGGLGVRTTRTGVMLVAPWAWAATAIMAVAVAVQVWVVLARWAEVVLGDNLLPPQDDDDDPAGDAGVGSGGPSA